MENTDEDFVQKSHRYQLVSVLHLLCQEPTSNTTFLTNKTFSFEKQRPILRPQDHRGNQDNLSHLSKEIYQAYKVFCTIRDSDTVFWSKCNVSRSCKSPMSTGNQDAHLSIGTDVCNRMRPSFTALLELVEGTYSTKKTLKILLVCLNMIKK